MAKKGKRPTLVLVNQKALDELRAKRQPAISDPRSHVVSTVPAAVAELYDPIHSSVLRALRNQLLVNEKLFGLSFAKQVDWVVYLKQKHRALENARQMDEDGEPDAATYTPELQIEDTIDAIGDNEDIPRDWMEDAALMGEIYDAGFRKPVLTHPDWGPLTAIPQLARAVAPHTPVTPDEWRMIRKLVSDRLEEWQDALDDGDEIDHEDAVEIALLQGIEARTTPPSVPPKRK